MVKEKAYAKINLHLDVVGKRFDGYHDLEMVMASVNLFDVLKFKKIKEKDILIESTKNITKNMEDNIVYKVTTMLQEEFAIDSGVTIQLEKNIPIAAGLAGGSADAAATIRGLNRVWKLQLSKQDMAKIGEQFGADVPFCVYNKLCVAKGKGEELFFLDKKLKMKLLLVYPNVHVSTKEVFSHVDPKNLSHESISDMTAAIYNRNYELLIRELHNALEPITFRLHPEVKELKNTMIDLGLDGALMSGTGSTVFGFSKSKEKLKKVQENLSKKYTTIITKIR